MVWNKSGFRRTKAALSLKRGKIGPRLLLTTNRKSHSYALSIGAKINDLGWHWRAIMHCVSNASFGAHPRKSEWRETCLKRFNAPKRCLWSVVIFQNALLNFEILLTLLLLLLLLHFSELRAMAPAIWFMRIFDEVPWRGAVKRQWCIKNVGLSRLSTPRLQQLKKWGQRYYNIIVILVTCRLSTDSKILHLEWLWMALVAILR